MVNFDVNTKKYFPNMKTDESVFLDSVTENKSFIDPIDNSQTIDLKKTPISDDYRFAAEKIKAFLSSQDVTLSILFNVLDSNSDTSLSKGEFFNKLSALELKLEKNELEALFNHLDKNKSGDITYNEFISEFSQVNTD